MEKRVISPQIQEEDLKIETSLRPQKLAEYIGQEKAATGPRSAIRGVDRRNNPAEKINVQNRQISKSGFYKMFSRSFAALQIYLYLRA